MFPIIQLIHREISEKSAPLSLSSIKKLHALIISTQLSHDPFYATRIVRLYGVRGQLYSARKLFDESPHRSVFLWNAIIRAYAQAQKFSEAFSLFVRMLRAHVVKPDNFTYACLTRACSERLDVHGLRVLHARALVSGLGSDTICGSSLVTAYSKLCLVDEASRVFQAITKPDLVLCNTMISAYGHCGCRDKSLGLFNMMQKSEKNPDGFTLVGLLSGLAGSSSVKIGQSIHGFCLKTGFDSNVHVSTALMNMYSKSKSTSALHKVFSQIPNPDLVSRSSLITGLGQSGDHKGSIFHFKELTFSGLKPDSILLASVCALASQVANSDHGKQVHSYVLKQGLECDVMVCSSLVDMYSKSGLLVLGIRVFDTMPRKNVVSYNALILGLGLHGRASEAFDKFEELLKSGLAPDEATFSSLLCACCHSGLVEEGKRLFDRMRFEFLIRARTEHYVHLVKLLGMNGGLEEAFCLTESLPQPVDHGILGALLSCCDACSDLRLAEIVGQRLIWENSPKSDSYKVMVSNIYANDGRWDSSMKLREETVLKTPGISWIEGTNNYNNSNSTYHFV